MLTILQLKNLFKKGTLRKHDHQWNTITVSNDPKEMEICNLQQLF